jgi:uncharacterized membrane protein YhhN
MTLLVLLTLIAVAVLLVAEHRGSRPGVWIAKPLASCGFIAVALLASGQGPALPSDPYGAWILVGLVLCLGGDVLLIPDERPTVFRLGILSFLLGHVAYLVAFASRGLDPLAAAATAVLLAVPVWGVVRWLRRAVPPDLAATVHAYIAVISLMVVCAVATVAEHGRPAILVGATMFYLSDLAVARDRFVAPGFINGAWGLPLYYGGQLVLAGTLAAG